MDLEESAVRNSELDGKQCVVEGKLLPDEGLLLLSVLRRYPVPNLVVTVELHCISDKHYWARQQLGRRRSATWTRTPSAHRRHGIRKPAPTCCHPWTVWTTTWCSSICCSGLPPPCQADPQLCAIAQSTHWHEQEDLYDEDMHVKEAAIGRISQLFLSFDALDALCKHPSLLPAFARHACCPHSLRTGLAWCAPMGMHVSCRVLREDSRRSADISLSIMKAFIALSTFSQLHGHLKALRVTGLTLAVLELALQEHIHRVRFA